MIDFYNYETVLLEDIAEFERAKKGKVYPKGTSTFQISATRGQIGYLETAREVKSKDVAIFPCSGINPRYFNIVLRKNVDEFLYKYLNGLNVKEKDVGKFLIQIQDTEAQEAVVFAFNLLDQEQQRAQVELNNLKNFKQNMLNKMMI
ncbi:MAG: restriction endonuclease subunit S [Limosilactobacillus sp.]|nr:restriction endonuclease subunit S [Limosilactobacillus sp.]